MDWEELEKKWGRKNEKTSFSGKKLAILISLVFVFLVIGVYYFVIPSTENIPLIKSSGEISLGENVTGFLTGMSYFIDYNNAEYLLQKITFSSSTYAENFFTECLKQIKDFRKNETSVTLDGTQASIAEKLSVNMNSIGYDIILMKGEIIIYGYGKDKTDLTKVVEWFIEK